MNLYNIPKHIRCTNCGECCYYIMVTKNEMTTIKKYIKDNHINPIKYKDMGKCCFRDEKNKRCLIYKVRPLVCMLFGVAKGMRCKNGNTTELDFRNIVQTEDLCFLNELIYNK